MARAHSAGEPTDPPAPVVVVVPAFNEEASVGEVVRTIRSMAYPVVVVDDGSSDDTASEARMAGAVVLQLPANLGVGAALRCGFRYAAERGYDVAVQCDADGQHRPDDIALLLAKMSEHDAHLVIGSRFAGDGRAYRVRRSRRLAMSVLSRLARWMTGVRLTDTTSGFRAIRQPLLKAFSRSYPAQYLGDTFEALIAAAEGGYRVVEVAVDMNQRSAGRPSTSSVASVGYVLRAVLTVLLGTSRRLAPYRTAPGSNGIWKEQP